MADRNDMNERHAQRLLRSLGSFDVDDEIEAALAERSESGGDHPAPYDIESFAAGDLFDGALRARIAAHLERCSSCYAEVKEFRDLLRGRPLITIPEAAAAAGDMDYQRISPDATIRIASLAERPGVHVIAIKLANPALRPRILRLNLPSGDALEEELSAPDKDGLIQFVKTVASQDDEVFIKRLLDAQLDFLDGSED
jgi:hypothetical protein